VSLPAFELNDSNYYGPDADMAYMSNSQYKSFLACEVAALAKVRGEWREEPSDAMLVGSYVHSALDGTLDHFKAANPDIFTKKGELKAEYKKADTMLETLVSDSLIREYLQGVKEFIITAEFAGTLWRAKLDIYNPTMNRIVDVKTVKSLTDKVWDKQDRQYMSWIESYGYIRQIAIYTELLRRWTGENNRADGYVVAVTKEDIPDKAIISIDQERIAIELEMVQATIPRILKVKSGEESPIGCGSCNYCKSVKKLDRVIHFSELVV
jgi:hypothetical protein